MANRIMPPATAGNPLMDSTRTWERLQKLRQRLGQGWQSVKNYTTVPEPPRVAVPRVPEFAYDEARVGNTTVRGVANTLGNENRSLSGPSLDNAEYAMARAIITGQLEPGMYRAVAPDSEPRNLSPQETEAARNRLRIARQAFIDAKLGRPDPAGGNSSYNHRDVRDVQRNRPRSGEPVYRNFGPFHNANPTRHVGRDAYIVIYQNRRDGRNK
jgi:hypothetical protein